MEKKIALKLLFDSGEKYKSNLENCNLLFVYGKTESFNYLETRFLGRNYLHLTGCQTSMFANEFYQNVVNKKLKEKDFELLPDGTTEVKLKILPELIYIDKKARMVGNYNSTRLNLKTDKLVGGVNVCVGFIKSDDSKFYIPNTLLGENIKTITDKPQERVLAVFKKKINEGYYSELSYLAKGIKINDLYKNKSLTAMIKMHEETKSNVVSLDKKQPLDLKTYKQKAKEYNDSRTSHKGNSDLEL